MFAIFNKYTHCGINFRRSSPECHIKIGSWKLGLTGKFWGKISVFLKIPIDRKISSLASSVFCRSVRFGFGFQKLGSCRVLVFVELLIVEPLNALIHHPCLCSIMMDWGERCDLGSIAQYKIILEYSDVSRYQWTTQRIYTERSEELKVGREDTPRHSLRINMTHPAASVRVTLMATFANGSVVTIESHEELILLTVPVYFIVLLSISLFICTVIGACFCYRNRRLARRKSSSFLVKFTSSNRPTTAYAHAYDGFSLSRQADDGMVTEAQA